MTYNVFGGTLNLTQSGTEIKVYDINMNKYLNDCALLFWSKFQYMHKGKDRKRLMLLA